MSMKSSDDIGNQTCDLLACGAVPQPPTAPPRAPSAFIIPKESHVTFPVHEHNTLNTPTFLPPCQEAVSRKFSISLCFYRTTWHHHSRVQHLPLMRNTQTSSKCHATRMFQLKGSILLTQFVPNVTMKIYYEQRASNITSDSSTMSKIPLLNQQTALWAKFLWYTGKQLYFEQSSSAKPADRSMSKIPLIYQQTALLWAKFLLNQQTALWTEFLWYTSRQLYDQNSSDIPADSSMS
jgi:hypothetical protein